MAKIKRSIHILLREYLTYALYGVWLVAGRPCCRLNSVSDILHMLLNA